MSRILLLGMCPLPFENETHTLGPGKRTWQFASSLQKDGHRICLICSRHLAAYSNNPLPPVVATELDSMTYYSLDQTKFEDYEWLQRIHDNFRPDCIIGATVYPSSVAASIRSDRPFWADLFGHLMAEAQTKSYVFNDDYYLNQMWKLEQTVLDRADIFSVVSEPQRFATIGELGTRGRLSKSTTGYLFVHTIPCATNDQLPPRESISPSELRGVLVDPNDFVLLWSGGYNTWTDVDTLFTGLEEAFSRNPRVRFVSTGGQIESHDDLTYLHFLKRIDSSRFRDRFIMKGWIPFAQVPAFWKDADAGINIDRLSYEAILGSRNRVLDWMQIRLPVFTSEVCELSSIIRARELGFTFRSQDVNDFVETLLFMADHPDLLKERAEAAHTFALEHFNPMTTTEFLRQWARCPTPAPDRHAPRPYIEKYSATQSLDYRHYIATIKNQLAHKGIKGTMKWVISRHPFSGSK